MTIPVDEGMRVVVFGELTGKGVLTVERVRSIGIDWEPPARRLKAELRRAEEEPWETF
jgi:hypothetical protein